MTKLVPNSSSPSHCQFIGVKLAEKIANIVGNSRNILQGPVHLPPGPVTGHCIDLELNWFARETDRKDVVITKSTNMQCNRQSAFYFFVYSR